MAMLWAILASVIILILAYIIRSAHTAFEVRNTFFLIVGVFLIIYIGAVIFVTYNINVWSAEKYKTVPSGSADSTYTFDEPFQEVDLTTYP